MSAKLPWDDPKGDAALGWAIARTVLAVLFYAAGKANLVDPVADSYMQADLFMNRLAKDILRSQKQEEPKP